MNLLKKLAEQGHNPTAAAAQRNPTLEPSLGNGVGVEDDSSSRASSNVIRERS
ncbi:hypothetical protein Syun_008243 [Stephania yunnanensis]|uniref:Uncharacterized protein n=1 Tax=Stephania yunnanensis TaxID=152371 RepID=A0AAP0PPD5_9MAGN